MNYILLKCGGMREREDLGALSSLIFFFHIFFSSLHLSFPSLVHFVADDESVRTLCGHKL